MKLEAVARGEQKFAHPLLDKYASLCTPLCKIIPACLNFRGLAPASFCNQPQPAKAAIFGKIGGKMINLARTFLHNSVKGI